MLIINFRFLVNLIFSGILAVILAACHNGATFTPKSNQFSPIAKQKLFKNKFNVSKIDLIWKIDGINDLRIINSSLKDMGWHFMTIKVAAIESTTPPTPVEGILAAVYPPAMLDKKQQVILQDINCKAAIFSKIGDSCSIYFKLNYDLSQGTTESVIFPVQFAPKGNIDAMLTFTSMLTPNTSIANHRIISPIEDQYYTAPNLAGNRNAYQILTTQNASLKPLKLINLTNPINPAFTLLHRSKKDNTDPYYANHAECALNSVPELNQVNLLSHLNESCILIYQAAATANIAEQRDSVSLNSDASHVFPIWANKYNLIAKYKNTPLPDRAITNVTGEFSEVLPFNNFMLSHTFTTTPIPIRPAKSSGTVLVLPDEAHIWQGEAILTNLGQTTTITSIMPINREGQILSQKSLRVTACGGAWASAMASAIVYKSVLQQNQIRFHLEMDSNGRCGSDARQLIDINVPMWQNFSQVLYNVNQRGCGGNNWDIGGQVSLNGICNEQTCSYFLKVSASHGGVGHQCHDLQSKRIDLAFPTPSTDKYAYLASAGDNRGVTFALPSGQNSSGSIGGKSGPINQKISCKSNGVCMAIGTYSNGLSSQKMGYHINLNSGDILNNGVIKFTRSSGYDLSSFTATMVN